MTAGPLGLATQYDWRRPADRKRSAVGDPIGRVMPLLTPNPARPFIQSDWPRAAAARWKATGEAVSILSPALTPNPPQPFHQNLWEGVKHLPKAIGEALAGDAPLLTPNPARPFNQNLWESPTRAYPKAVGEVFGVGIPPPFFEADWPLVAPPKWKLADASIAAPLPIYLPNPAQPFLQDDWPPPRGAMFSDRGFGFGFNLNLQPIITGTFLHAQPFLVMAGMLLHLPSVIFSPAATSPTDAELREDVTFELREDGSFELRDAP